MKRSSQWVLDYSLSLERKKLPTGNMVLKPCQSYLPELLWHFMSQLHGLAVLVNNRHKNTIFGVVGFQSSNLTSYWLISWFVNKKHIQLRVFCTDSIIFHELWVSNIFHPLFGLESQIMTFTQACCAGCRRRPLLMQLHQQAKPTHSAKLSLLVNQKWAEIINRPGVAGAVL